jgi:ATP-binding cassette subfamily C (CFTR/MRP) protein 1
MLSYALSTTQTLNWIVRSATEVETKCVFGSSLPPFPHCSSSFSSFLHRLSLLPLTPSSHSIVSVERVQEYINLKPEAPLEIPSTEPPADWPQTGSIKFEHVQARYRPELDLVLKDINFEIKGGESIGVVGRTGAGKSSLTMVRFRVVSLFSSAPEAEERLYAGPVPYYRSCRWKGRNRRNRRFQDWPSRPPFPPLHHSLPFHPVPLLPSD